MSELIVENVSKSYDGRKIIKNISLTLHEGELVSILGVSGGGKTTLFNVISGLTEPDEGGYSWTGRISQENRAVSATCSRRTCCCLTVRWKTMWRFLFFCGAKRKRPPGSR